MRLQVELRIKEWLKKQKMKGKYLIIALTLIFGVSQSTAGDTDQEEKKIVPVNYPFEKFEKAVDRLVQTDGYSKIFLESKEGIHGTTLSKNLFHYVFIMAESRQNKAAGEYSGYEQFIHKNKKCHYYLKPGKDGKRGTGSLVIEVPEYDTYISIHSTAAAGKEDMVNLFDKLDF